MSARPMTSQLTDPWVTARERFLQTLTDEQQKVFTYASPENIFYTTAAEQRKYQEDSRAAALVSKLKPFLDAVSNYGTALDVFSNSSSMIMCPLWGSIRVLLQIAREFQSYLEKLVDMLVSIGDLLPNLLVYQKIFAGHHALFNALSDVYLDVISFCSKAKEVFSKGKRGIWRITIKLCWGSFETEFGEIVAGFRRHKLNVEDQAHVAHMIEESQARREAQLERERQLVIHKEMKRQKLLKMLSKIDHHSRHRKLRKARHEKTGTWIFSTKQYEEWISEKDSCCLWCYGIPGSGKTILMTSVVDKLMESASSPGMPVAVYFYCDYSHHDSLDASMILENFILQLLSAKSEIPEEIDSVLMSAYNGIIKPDFDKLVDILLSVTKLFQQIFIVLDGIDECTDGRVDLLRFVHSILEPGPTVVKLLLASRADVDLSRAFRSYPSLQISGNDISADIEAFVNGIISEKLESHELVIHDPELVKEVSKALIDGAQGMFLWVTFQIKDLCDESCDSDIRRALQDLPNGLVGTYSRALRKIHRKAASTTSLVQKIFKWMTCARRPLTMDEIREAISISPGDRLLDPKKIIADDSRIIKACANLAVFNNEHRTIQFAHYSVKEYLLRTSTDDSVEEIHFRLQDAEREVGEICVTYLSFQSFGMQVARAKRHDPMTSSWGLNRLILSESSRNPYIGWVFSATLAIWERLGGYKTSRYQMNVDWNEFLKKTSHTPLRPELAQEFRLLNYVVENWVDHTTGFLNTNQLWSNFEILALEQHLPFSFRPWGDMRTIKSLPYMSMVLWAIEKGHEPLLQLLLDPKRYPKLGVYLDQKIAIGEGESKLSVTALQRLIINGHGKCVNLLLENAKFKSVDTNSALDLAAQLGVHDSINLLLDLGARPYSLDASDMNTSRPLYLAVDRGHDRMVKCLLERHVAGTAIDFAKESGHTALHLAAKRGHDKVAQCLLDHGDAGIDLLDEDGYTALHLAIRSGHDKVVQCLLDHPDVSIDIEGKDGYATLYLAVESKHEKILRYLLDHLGSDMDVTGRRGCAAFRWAAEGGHYKVAECLLDYSGVGSAGVAEKDEYTMLHRVAKSGHDKLVQCLLDYWFIGIHISDKDGYTALRLAAENKHDKVVQCLLNHWGAGIDIADKDGNTALHLAVENRHDKLVQCLLDGGAGIGIANKNGSTVLHVAIKRRYDELAQFLLERGLGTPAINIPDKDGNTALHLAVENGHDKLVQCLLDGGAGIGIANKNGSTVLHVAIKRRHDELAQFLLERGLGTPAINIPDNDGFTVLHLAAENGKDSFVQSLLAKGASIDTTNLDGNTALHLAVEWERDEVVQCLVDGGAGIDIANDNGDTALHLAVEWGRDKLVRCLVDGGAGIDIANGDGDTALHVAVKERHDKLAQLLLEGCVFGAPVINIPDNAGNTALHLAAEWGHIKVAQCLMDGGAGIDIANKSGYTALHLAASNGYDKLVKCLLERGSRVNSQKEDGYTALHLAVGGGHDKAVQCLLNGGASIDITNKRGHTAFHLAARKRNDTAVQYLLRW